MALRGCMAVAGTGLTLMVSQHGSTRWVASVSNRSGAVIWRKGFQTKAGAQKAAARHELEDRPDWRCFMIPGVD